MKHLAHRSLLLLALLALATALAPRASADTAVLTKAGTLHEVVAVRDAASNASAIHLRTTLPDGTSTDQIVPGTEDQGIEIPGGIEFEPTTGTVFIVYMKAQGLMTDVRVAALRNGSWAARDIVPSRGIYLSMNPRMAVTRQAFTVSDASGKPVVKKRSILSLVWWEEVNRSQALYAPIFVEDGTLNLDEINVYSLNELAGTAGETPTNGLPASSYQFPAVQREGGTNGGVVVSFANLANRTQTAIRVSFADDLVKLAAEAPAGQPPTEWAQARAHVPIGRELSAGGIQASVDTQSDVGIYVSTAGVGTFFWNEGNTVLYTTTDAAAGEKPRSISIRRDFSRDKILSVLREMAERE